VIALLKQESDISQDLIHVHCNSEMDAANLKTNWAKCWYEELSCCCTVARHPLCCSAAYLRQRRWTRAAVVIGLKYIEQMIIEAQTVTKEDKITTKYYLLQLSRTNCCWSVNSKLSLLWTKHNTWLENSSNSSHVTETLNNLLRTENTEDDICTIKGSLLM